VLEKYIFKDPAGSSEAKVLCFEGFVSHYKKQLPNNVQVEQQPSDIIQFLKEVKIVRGEIEIMALDGSIQKKNLQMRLPEDI
jgi:hypothetical protein